MVLPHVTLYVFLNDPVSLMDQNKSQSVPWTPCFHLLRAGSPCGPAGRWGGGRSPSFCRGTQNKPAENSECFQHAAGSLTARYHTAQSFPPEKTWLSGVKSDWKRFNLDTYWWKTNAKQQKTWATALQQQIFRDWATATALPVHSVQNKSLAKNKSLENICFIIKFITYT